MMLKWMIIVFVTLNYPSQEPPVATYEFESPAKTAASCTTVASDFQQKLNEMVTVMPGLHFDVLCRVS